jgi:hypothetical protein
MGGVEFRLAVTDEIDRHHVFLPALTFVAQFYLVPMHQQDLRRKELLRLAALG